MKKFALVFLFLIICMQCVFAEVSLFSENKKFGLKNELGDTIVPAKYKKLVRLGEKSWIMQSGTKFGIINDNGDVVAEPIYNQAERLLNKYVKFRKGSNYCLLDENGNDVIGNSDNSISVEMFSSIDLLYGGFIVTSKNHKYGLRSFNGVIRLDNIFDDIYMTDKNTMVIVYGNKSMEFKKNADDTNQDFSFEFEDLQKEDLSLSDIKNSPFATTGYYGVTLTDYILKFFFFICILFYGLNNIDLNRIVCRN